MGARGLVTSIVDKRDRVLAHAIEVDVNAWIVLGHQ